MARFGRKGLNQLSHRADGVGFDNQGKDLTSVTYRGAIPELQGMTFSVPRFNGSGRKQREYIESRHRESKAAEEAAQAAREAADELAATRQELKDLKTQVKRLRTDAAATVQMLLTAAGVDRERALVALTNALDSDTAPGQVPALLSVDEIGSWLSKVEQRQQDEQKAAES